MGALTVAIYEQPNHQRAKVVCNAMLAGARACGYQAELHKLAPDNGVAGDIAIFYGFQHPLPRLMEEYKAAGKPAIHIDLGYFGRVDGGPYDGFHKIAVNARHPDAYFRNRVHDADRIARFGIDLQPWRAKGDHILIAGMSAKHARSEGWAPRQWEIDTIAALRAVTKRPIRYRPKPSDSEARPIDGTEYAKSGSIESHLENCHVVVTHHSNAAIDAAVRGVPSLSVTGVSTVIGTFDPARIERPSRPGDRAQWLADVAYCQWNVKEMKSGACLRHLIDEGLVPA